MVMCCSKKVFISLCKIYRKSSFKLATKSRERKEKLVLFRATKTASEPKVKEIVHEQVEEEKKQDIIEAVDKNLAEQNKEVAQNADPTVRLVARSNLKKLQTQLVKEQGEGKELAPEPAKIVYGPSKAMRNLVRTLLALKTLKLQKEMQNKAIPWLNLDDDMQISEDEEDGQKNVIATSEDAVLEANEAQTNILDVLRGQIDQKARARLDKAKEAGVAEMQNIMTNFQSTLQAVLQTKKDALTATKMPKTELFLQNLNSAFLERKSGEPEVLQKLLLADKKLKEKKKVEKEKRSVRRLTHHQTNWQSEGESETEEVVQDVYKLYEQAKLSYK